MSIEIVLIGLEQEADLKLRNEPFPLFGRLIPALQNGIWTWREELFESPAQMCFPEEDYALAEDRFYLGAYEDSTCIGLAVLEKSWTKYLYLSDLKVRSASRRKGIGHLLIEEALNLARQYGYRGLSVVAQDNNLAACRFYLKEGFVIGGFDNQVYTGTSQAGKADVYFYRDLP